MEGVWLPYREEKVMTKQQLAQLSSPLVTIGSHSLTHPHLSKIDEDSARKEIEGSCIELQNLTGQKVRLFAFPYGDYDASVIDFCKSVGYEFVFSDAPMQIDTTRPAILRGRIHVDPSDGPLEFFLKCSGAYTWMTYVIPSLKR